MDLEQQEAIRTTLYSPDETLGCDVEYGVTGFAHDDPCAGVTRITAAGFRYGTMTGYVPRVTGTQVEIGPSRLDLELGETPPSGSTPVTGRLPSI